MFKNTQTSYGSVAKLFHWTIFILVAFMLFLGFFMDDIEKPLRGAVINIHKILGLTILSLMILRLLWALIAMPLSGWIGSVAAGYVPHFFGLSLGLPISQSKSLGELSFSTHKILAYTIIALVSLHVLAALYHHIIKKDNILLRMMP
jgi:cytochrome b561